MNLKKRQVSIFINIIFITLDKTFITFMNFNYSDINCYYVIIRIIMIMVIYLKIILA